MNGIYDAVGSFPWLLVCLISLMLLTGQLAVLFIVLRQRWGKKGWIPVLIQFLAGFCLFVLLMDCCTSEDRTAWMANMIPLEKRLLALPWGSYLGAEILLAAALFFSTAGALRYRRSHLTTEVIRETVNFLPAAVCVCDPAGTVLLANLKMDGLSRSLAGEPLRNAAQFWNRLEQLREEPHQAAEREQLMVPTPGGEVWLFFRDSFTADGKEYQQIIAENMTEQHRITEALASENRRLRRIQARMKEVSARERSLVTEREIMNARMTVHNQMGNVLLVGKYYMDHPENINEAELLRLLEYNNYFLLGEVERPDPVPDPYEEALRTAGKIGVKVEVTGTVPEGPARKILAQAIDQCAANAARHAGADRMAVAITEKDGRISAELSNNGEPARGPIRETGGLAALRRTAEEAGGTMKVRGGPVFTVTLTLPAEAAEQ